MMRIGGRRRRYPPDPGRLPSGVGQRIRMYREKRGITQTQLGAPYFTRAHVSAIERGRTSPALKSLAHFAGRLRVRVRDLIPPDI